MSASDPARPPRLAYLATLAMLILALAFPIALMVFNPTLMFERGWEQYVGTSIYAWATLTLARELLRLWREERAFRRAPQILDAHADADQEPGADASILAGRLSQLAGAQGGTAAQLLEINREASALDQEHAAGRFTLTRYILYLLPVIGFIGTVEGISKALMNISRVLPMVKELDGFLNNLTSVTAAFQIAFDSTLLALFLSAALMLVQLLVNRRSEDLLGRVDRWVVQDVLPRLGRSEEGAQAHALAEALTPHFERMHRDLVGASEQTARALEALANRLGEGLGPHVERFSEAVDRLPPTFEGFRKGAEAIGRLGDDMEVFGTANEALRRGVASLGRIEATLAASAGDNETDEQLVAIRRGLDRACEGVEALSGSFANSFERSSRATQEQLARTLGSLKDALDLLQVSMEQGNTLYRSIVKKMLPSYFQRRRSPRRLIAGVRRGTESLNPSRERQSSDVPGLPSGPKRAWAQLGLLNMPV